MKFFHSFLNRRQPYFKALFQFRAESSVAENVRQKKEGTFTLPVKMCVRATFLSCDVV